MAKRERRAVPQPVAPDRAGVAGPVVLVCLWLAVMISALAVVNNTHRARVVFHELELLRKQAHQLEADWGRFLLEQSTWAAYSRVEQLAVDELEMTQPEMKDVIVVASEK